MDKKQGAEKIDTHYYHSLLRALKGEPNLPVALRPLNYNEQKKRFFLNLKNPKFKYKKFSKKKYILAKKILKGLKEKLQKENNEYLAELYLRKIDEIKNQLGLRFAIGRNSKNLFEYSLALYGKPDSKDLKKAFFDFEEEEKLKRIQDTKKTKIFNAEEVCQVFNRAIKKLKIGDWKAIIEPKAKSITINPKNKKGYRVEVPADKKLDKFGLERLVNHEIATHLARNRAGELSPLWLLAFIGADRYHPTEEGLALYAEQVSLKRRKMVPPKSAPLTTITIGAALSDRNFRETFQYLINLKISPERAWRQTFRVFRGISDTSKKTGHILTFDWRYRKGNLSILQFVKKKGDRALDKLWVGKIGLEHLEIMKSLKITESMIQRKYFRIEELLKD